MRDTTDAVDRLRADPEGSIAELRNAVILARALVADGRIVVTRELHAEAYHLLRHALRLSVLITTTCEHIVEAVE